MSTTDKIGLSIFFLFLLVQAYVTGRIHQSFRDRLRRERLAESGDRIVVACAKRTFSPN